MKRYIVLSIILTMILTLYSQSIDMKMRRLEYIQDMIERKRTEMERTQEELGHLSRDRESFEERYQRTMSKIDQLSTRESEIARNLTESRREMEMSQGKIDDMTELWLRQYYLFFVIHQTDGKRGDNAIDKQYLPIMINQTKDRIDENKDLLAGIVRNIEQTQRTQQNIRSERTRENQIVSNYRNEIGQLSDRISKLSLEEQQIAREFESLLESRRGLENMITHFQTAQEGRLFSYQFTTNKLLWPARGEVINTFGETRNELYNITLMNNGIDILLDKPEEIRAVDFGVVVFAETYRNYGRLIIIDHHNGYYSLYANNGNLLVTKDETVELGQVISLAGRKNNSDNYMLHFELRRHTVPVDPLVYLE